MAGKGHTGQVPRAGGGLVATPSAREMFEALGFEYIPDKWDYLFSWVKKGDPLEAPRLYDSSDDWHVYGDTVIEFHKTWKQYWYSRKWMAKEHGRTSSGKLTGIRFDIHEAIHQQILELGW